MITPGLYHLEVCCNSEIVYDYILSGGGEKNEMNPGERAPEQ